MEHGETGYRRMTKSMKAQEPSGAKIADRNNLFHTKTMSPWAITYNDKSVLENMHVASAFKVMLQDGHGGKEMLAEALMVDNEDSLSLILTSKKEDCYTVEASLLAHDGPR